MILECQGIQEVLVCLVFLGSRQDQVVLEILGPQGHQGSLCQEHLQDKHTLKYPE